SAFFEQPRIHSLPAEPDIVERQRAEAKLGDKNGAGVVKALDDSGILGGDAAAKRLSAVRGRDAGCIEKIFSAPGYAVERAAVFSGGDFGVGLFSLREGEIAGESDDAAKFRVKLGDAIEVDMSEALGSELSLLDPTRKFCNGRKSDVFVV